MEDVKTPVKNIAKMLRNQFKPNMAHEIETFIEEYEDLQSDLAALKKIADFAFDIHTRDPVNVKKKWGVCGVKAEEKLCEMIESQKKGN